MQVGVSRIAGLKCKCFAPTARGAEQNDTHIAFDQLSATVLTYIDNAEASQDSRRKPRNTEPGRNHVGIMYDLSSPGVRGIFVIEVQPS